MKAFHLKPEQKIPEPYGKEVLSMIETVLERRVQFQNGIRGFIIENLVLAPFFMNESCIAKKDGHDLVLTYKATDKWGVSYFQLPFPIICEPLHFRHTPLKADSFMFMVFDEVTLCSGFKVKKQKGRFEVNSPEQFCPVFDRHGHIIGLNTGMFNSKPICIPIKNVL